MCPRPLRVLLADDRGYVQDPRSGDELRAGARRRRRSSRRSESPPARRRRRRAARSRASRLIRRSPKASDRGGRRRRRRWSSARARASRVPAKQQFSERLCPAVLSGDPAGVEIDEREVRRLALCDQRGRQAEQRRSGAHPLDAAARGRAARGSRGRCAAQRRRSQGRSCPSAPARTGPPSHRVRGGRGRWRRSRSSRRAVPRAARGGPARWRAAGYIFMLVFMPLTSSSVSSRWCGLTSALTRQPAALACSRPPRRMRRS